MSAASLVPPTREYVMEDTLITFNVSGTIVVPDDLGKAVMIDSATAMTVKLCTDGAEIFGRLETYEDRTNTDGVKIGTVALNFIGNLPLKSGETPAPGDQLVGYTGGLTKVRTAQTVVDTGTSGTTITVAPGRAKPCTVLGATATDAAVSFGV